MKGYPASINDIARSLGLSASTVSRALSNHPDINADTARRVKEYALAVKYRPNALAIGLKHQRSNTIGIIVPEIIHHFFSSIISGIEEIAYSKGMRVMICQSNEDYNREVIGVQAFVDHRVDGLLVSHSKTTFDFSHFREVIDSHVPLVFIDRFVNDIQTDRVFTDDFQGGKLITEHLLQRGRKRILHLATSKKLHVGFERHRGFAEALYEAGVSYNEDLVMYCDTPQKAFEAKDQIIEKAPKIDGIFAVNDFTAIAVLNILRDAGYQVPGDIAVAGFGDDPIAQVVRPQLTTVEQNGFDMGKMAVEMLIGRIERPDEVIQPRSVVQKVTLKIRDSTN